MEVQERKIVTIHYKLVDVEGKLIDSSEGAEPLAYLHGSGQLIPGLEKSLLGKKSGDKFDAVIAPADAYGERDSEQIREVPQEQLSSVEGLTVGMQLEGVDDQGNRAIFTVQDIADATVTLDANHPLAGMELHFSVEVVDVREPTSEELEHGHAHGPGGHQH